LLDRIEKIEINKDSHPFATASGKLDFEKNGYIEEEFYMHGAANIYKEDDKKKAVIQHSDIPYCNRFIVRRPKELSKFSGNVFVEILNATARMDIDRIWVSCNRQFMWDNDIYIGITSKPDVLDALLAFDEKRYAKLNWQYPFTRDTDKTANRNHVIYPVHPECETGLFWDMLTDMALLIRQWAEKEGISERVCCYLTGWSQSVSYLLTYIRYFSFLKPFSRDTGAFDGYFAAGGVNSLKIPLNQDGFYELSMDYVNPGIVYMPVPYIAVQTESENAHFGGYEARQDDSDRKDLLYRCYEISGSTHDTKATLLDYYKNDKDVKKIGMTPRYMGQELYPNDYDYSYVFGALIYHLKAWVREGILPPKAERILTDKELNNRTDRFGNATGGVRTPFIDVPTRTYCNFSFFNNSKDKNMLFGNVKPFSKELLKSLYGGIDRYGELIKDASSKCIEEGFLLPEDKELLIAEALRMYKEIEEAN